MMKRILLAAAWFAVCTYAMASAILGPSGLLATRNAQSAAADMRENLKKLEGINGELNERWNGLRSDPVSIALEGRSLGYIAVDEVAIRLPVAMGRTVSMPGETLFYAAPPSLRERDARIIAALAGMVAVIVSAFLVLSGKRRRPDTHGPVSAIDGSRKLPS